MPDWTYKLEIRAPSRDALKRALSQAADKISSAEAPEDFRIHSAGSMEEDAANRVAVMGFLVSPGKEVAAELRREADRLDPITLSDTP